MPTWNAKGAIPHQLSTHLSDCYHTKTITVDSYHLLYLIQNLQVVNAYQLPFINHVDTLNFVFVK